MIPSYFSTNNIIGDLDIACDDILRLINDNLDFLFQEENLNLLAYILWRWECLYNNGRIVYGNNSEEDDIINQCTISPKNKLENGQVINYKNRQNIKIIKYAWKVIISETHASKLENDIKTNEFFEKLEKPIYDEWDILYWKKNKTLEDWVNFLSNKKHKNHSLYSTKQNIYNHLFCAMGNGYKWNSDGFLDSSVKTTLFGDFYYAKDLLPDYIKLPLYEILYRPKCVYANVKAWEINERQIEIEIFKRLKNAQHILNNFSEDINKLSDKEKYALYTKEIDTMVFNRANNKKLEHYDIFNNSRFINAPKNIDSSYVNIIRKITFEILKDKHLYHEDDLETLNIFIKNNPQWFRKKTIENILNICQ